jgi:hypothetical protein
MDEHSDAAIAVEEFAVTELEDRFEFVAWCNSDLNDTN